MTSAAQLLMASVHLGDFLFVTSGFFVTYCTVAHFDLHYS